MTPAQSADTIRADLVSVTLNRQVYFVNPDEGDTIAEPGTYSVSVAGDSRLKLLPADRGEAMVIAAQLTDHPCCERHQER